VYEEYKIILKEKPSGYYDSVVVAVSHKEYLQMNESDFKSILAPNSIFVDIKGVFKQKINSIDYWSL